MGTGGIEQYKELKDEFRDIVRRAKEAGIDAELSALGANPELRFDVYIHEPKEPQGNSVYQRIKIEFMAVGDKSYKLGLGGTSEVDIDGSRYNEPAKGVSVCILNPTQMNAH